MHQNTSRLRILNMREPEQLEPPAALRGKILMRIGQEERRRAKIFLSASIATISLSTIGIMYSIQYMVQGFYQSSFYSYFSLLISDPDIVLAYWREFVLSLAESFPLIGIIASLMAIVILLLSIRVLANNVRYGLMPLPSHL